MPKVNTIVILICVRDFGIIDIIDIMKESKKAITASKLRENVCRILDEILKTGTPVEIDRRGKRYRISPAEPINKLGNLVIL